MSLFKYLDKNIANFFRFDPDEKLKILSFYDWFGNRLMRNRDSMHLTYRYRTMNDWCRLFEVIGFTHISSEFIKTNSSRPDLFPPKAVMIFEKA